MLRGSLIALLFLFAAVAPAASADEAPEKPIEPLGLTLSATNGYKAEIIAVSDPSLGRSAAVLALGRPGSSASYSTSVATVTASSIEARFGALGEINVHLVATGGSTTERARVQRQDGIFPVQPLGRDDPLSRCGRVRVDRRSERQSGDPPLPRTSLQRSGHRRPRR